jgi:heat shock protein HslJ
VSWATRGAWVALLGLLLSACGDSGDENASAGPPPFEGIPWVVTSGLDAPGAAEHAPSMTFDDGEVSGSAGCNTFRGRFTTTGDTLDISGPAVTLMACVGPQGAVEREFLDKLARVTRWRMDGEELVLAADDGQELLRLGEASLIGDWEATSFRQRDAVASLLPDTEITARFGSDGTLAGSAGCNRYSAGFTTDGGSLTIEPPVLTRMACEKPDGVMKQEQQYVEALPRAASYTFEGQMLTLLAADGTIIATYLAR